MGAQWKPGDVAQYDGSASGRLFCMTEGWIDSYGDDRAPAAALLRPLVVIDPEDREQVERLAGEFFAASDPSRSGIQQFQAGLRSLVSRPRPVEPTGLGAVVEDENGHYWVRGGNVIYPWCHATHEGGVWQPWSDLPAIRQVVSEGVTQ